MIEICAFVIEHNRVGIAPDTGINALKFSVLTTVTQKLLSKLVTKTIP